MNRESGKGIQINDTHEDQSFAANCSTSSPTNCHPQQPLQPMAIHVLCLPDLAVAIQPPECGKTRTTDGGCPAKLTELENIEFWIVPSRQLPCPPFLLAPGPPLLAQFSAVDADGRMGAVGSGRKWAESSGAGAPQFCGCPVGWADGTLKSAANHFPQTTTPLNIHLPCG